MATTWHFHDKMRSKWFGMNTNYFRRLRSLHDFHCESKWNGVINVQMERAKCSSVQVFKYRWWYACSFLIAHKPNLNIHIWWHSYFSTNVVLMKVTQWNHIKWNWQGVNCWCFNTIPPLVVCALFVWRKKSSQCQFCERERKWNVMHVDRYIWIHQHFHDNMTWYIDFDTKHNYPAII